MAKLKHIDLNTHGFRYNVNALEECFGYKTEAETLQRGTYYTNDGCYAWFPKEELTKNGTRVSGSSTSNWKNRFEENGNIIFSYLYEGELPSKNSDDEPKLKNINPLYCFWSNSKDQEYKYVGTYLCDEYASAPRRKIYRRLATEIDLSKWYNNEILDSYTYEYDLDNFGRDFYKDYYLSNDFKTHKKKVLEFENSNYNKKLEQFEEKQKIIESKSFKDNDFLEELLNYINSIYLDDISRNELTQRISELFPLLTTLCKYDENTYKRIEILQTSAFDEIQTGKLFSIYKPDYYLYGLSEKETEYYLGKLNIEFDETTSILEKHHLLYFWKQCNSQLMGEWSTYKFYLFLQYTFGIVEIESETETIEATEVIDTIDLDTPVEEEVITESEAMEEEQNQKIYKDSTITFPDSFEFTGVAKEKPNVVVSSTTKTTIPRDVGVKINCLVHAHFKCEYDENHKSFTSRATGNPYMETHHLIPLEYRDRFSIDIDCEENVVSLCSNCHNEIHYGKDAEVLLRKLYDERKDYLAILGINITFDQLLTMYRLK